MGNIQTFITFTVLIIAIIIAIVIWTIRTSFIEKTQFGSFTDETISSCKTSSGLCTETGIRTITKRCIPNPVTGKGCLRDDGVQTYLPQITHEQCTPLCKTSEWVENVEECKIYNNPNGTNLSNVQDCKNDGQYSLSLVRKLCVAKDTEGDNTCIKQDGSLASIGGQEISYVKCGKPSCQQGSWSNCSIPGSITFGPCAIVPTECGKVVPLDGSAKCLNTNGVEIGEQFCDTNTEPDCTGINTGCLVYTCPIFPIGYIAAFQNKRLLFDLVIGVNTTFSVNYTPDQAILANNLQEITTPVTVTVTSDPSRYLYFFFLPTHIYPSGQMYFVAILPPSNQLMMVEESIGGFILKPLPTSIGTPGLDGVAGLHRFTLTTATAGATYNMKKVAPLPVVDLCTPFPECLIITASNHTIF